MNGSTPSFAAAVLCVVTMHWTGLAQETLPGTKTLEDPGDLSARMVAGIDRLLMREIQASTDGRARFWQRDFSSPEAYEKSVAPNRERFRTIIGATDPRPPAKRLEFIGFTTNSARIAEADRFAVYAVRWPVFEDVFGEGLLLEPKSETRAHLIALPDADQTPEQLVGLAPGVAPEAQFARRLAENGCQVLVPTLVDRQDTWSGNAKLKRFTNLPHREWIYRQAYEMGRHIIGYEVQKVLAAVDWFAQQTPPRNVELETRNSAIGVAGYGEGGLIALYSAALDPRIAATLVSAYFDNRDHLWEEPIYRNVFTLLREFGDAEIASLIAPRALIVEHAGVPTIDGPPKPREGRTGAAPGRIQTPDFNTVDYEVERARSLVPTFTNYLRFLHGNEGMTVGPCGEQAVAELLGRLGVAKATLRPLGELAVATEAGLPDPAERQKRQVDQLVGHTQRLMRWSERARNESFWRTIRAKTATEWAVEVKARQTNFWEDIIGPFPKASVPANARSRLVYDNEKWTGYDVVLGVHPDVFAWGVLLLPKNLQPRERRPVVVCQHGLEGLPADTITEDPNASGYRAYKAFSARLAERGFVVFAPHNPYRGREAFRVLQRKANPLGQSIFSVILSQHERILDWLSEQPFVDPTRIGFYGLSYGGKTAMRVPSLLSRYCLSICSADFNEWVTKCATTDSPYSYLYTIEHDMYEFDLGHTFNYAEMAALIAPRPFMVERGHDDGVAPDEWVAHEYARVRRFYDKLGIGDRTEIEFFNGPHTINGQGTFRFLHRHLHWPEPK